MNIDKKIISQIWDGCEKQIVDGYVFIKMDDLIKLKIKETSNQKEKINMDKVAAYLNNKGWIFERNPDTEQIWRRRPGDIHNREKV